MCMLGAKEVPFPRKCDIFRYFPSIVVHRPCLARVLCLIVLSIFFFFYFRVYILRSHAHLYMCNGAH